MAKELPIVCSLGADDLTARLDLIAAIGAPADAAPVAAALAAAFAPA